MARTKKVETVEEYIKSFPEDIQTILERLREAIRKAAPEAADSISYGMPTFKVDGKRLVYFSAWKNHVGFYSIPSGDEDFRKELAPYQGEKGSLRFPLERPIPYDLVRKIVLFRLKEIRTGKT